MTHEWGMPSSLYGKTAEVKGAVLWLPLALQDFMAPSLSHDSPDEGGEACRRFFVHHCIFQNTPIALHHGVVKAPKYCTTLYFTTTLYYTRLHYATLYFTILEYYTKLCSSIELAWKALKSSFGPCALLYDSSWLNKAVLHHTAPLYTILYYAIV